MVNKMKFSNVKYRHLLADQMKMNKCNLLKWFGVALILLVCLFVILPLTDPDYNYYHNVDRLYRNEQSAFKNRKETLVSMFSKLSNKYDDELDSILSVEGSATTIQNTTAIPMPRSIQLNTSETYKLAESESNLALFYWEKWNTFSEESSTTKSGVEYCKSVKFTDPFYLKHTNLYWQQLNVKVSTGEQLEMQLLSAFYDKKHGDPVIRIFLANPKAKLTKQRNWRCLIWFDKMKWPVLTKVSDYFTMMGNTPGYFHPEMITCPIPEQHAGDIPAAVSLQTETSCDTVESVPSNILRVVYEPRSEKSKHQRSIGVCVQGFRFGSYDVSVRLIEWLEMIKLMQADNVYFYVFGAMDNMRKVIKQYEQEGFLVSRPITLPGYQPNVGSLYNLWAFKLGEEFWPQELIEINDCLYRNLYKHDYIAIFDVDEMIVPQQAANWLELIEQTESKLSSYELQTIGYYTNRHAYVCQVHEETTRNGQPIPEYLYMMRHTYHSKIFDSWSNVKVFHRTDQVIAAHNHASMRCKGNKLCKSCTLSPEDSILWHYRRNHTSGNANCPIHEHSAWRWYDELERNVRNKLIRIFSPDKRASGL